MKIKERSIVVLLIDDQKIIAQAIEEMLRDEKNITFHYCSDPTQALLTAHQVNPTVILQDLVMPGIDGLVLVKYFKAAQEIQNVPLIVLSSKEEPVIKAKAFALGANDYLVKLPDKIELLARISYHSKCYISSLERNEAYQKLAESERVLKAELAEAADYVKSLLPQPLKGKPEINWEFLPSQSLGGDSFGYHWLDDEHLAIYLIDVCGHGVGAALLSVTVLNVLENQTLQTCDFHDPAMVLHSLNENFSMEKHNQMFFTGWYGVFNKTNRLLTYASGGHPPAILFNGKNSTPEKLTTDGMIIGGLDGTHYKNASVVIDKDNEFYLFSDGVFEVHNADEKMLGYDKFVDRLRSEKNIEAVTHSIKEYRGNRQLEDDFSLLHIKF